MELSFLRDLDKEFPGIVPDLVPEARLVKHAFQAILENWNVAHFDSWESIAEHYVEEHYAGRPDMTTRGRVEREERLALELEGALRRLVAAPDHPRHEAEL